MDTNENDGIFSREAEIDERMRARDNGGPGKRSGKSGQSSPAVESLDEDAPLLDNEERSRRNSSGHDSDDEPVQWFGTVELEGLPWWKRPSVCRPTYHHRS